MLIYIAIFVLCFIGVSLCSFWLITHPPKIIIGTTPENYGLKHENVELETEDGLKLAAWFIPTSNLPASPVGGQFPTSALILIHGYPAEKADLLSLAKALSTKYSILLFDFRSFGQSEGKVSTLGKKELLDLEAALDWLENREFKKLGIFGFSLGGAVTIMKAAEDNRIQAVAAYAPFADLRLLGYDAYKNLWLLKYPLVELLSRWTKLFFDYDIATLSPEKAAEKLQIPIFLFHQKQDAQIPFEHALKLKAALSRNPKAEFDFPETGSHGDFPFDFGETLLDFFGKSLK